MVKKFKIFLIFYQIFYKRENKMNRLKLLPLYIVLAFFSGALLLYVRWPFYEQALLVAIVSVPAIFLLSKKWIPVFLFGVLILSIGYASQEPAFVLTSIGTYFLLSIFQFSLWSTADKLKQTADETDRLREQYDFLSQKNGELRVLSLQEFIEQALWMMKTSTHKERTWFMEVVPAMNCPVLTAELEQVALCSIASGRDLVTSKEGKVYLLVKETEEQALQPLIHSFEKAMHAEDHIFAYEIRKTRITKVAEMRSLLS
ncbi:hypothetical protein [Planococcus sp. ISL-109]|uniref:hypothetical protein n=1 Tax=Planococcus sp. ISL-109 TaxID=2819166 RepID=UPI001BED22F5|nr:hypothetical protein [Planococcus sp. ISL-109]MBT2581571.1 hypothetical protein [Planococcus sp. ISL-109]